MSMFRRFGFFMLVNALIMTTIYFLSMAVNLFIFGEPFPPQNQIGTLMVWAGLWGFGGAFISLFMSKFLAKRMYGLKMIDSKTAYGMERDLIETVHRLARAAQLPAMPEVGIYESPEMNAFATGPSKGNSLVAVSTGLMRSMNRDQVEGVLGHEVAHIANGDMVTMTLLQGVINAFVLFFARILAKIVAGSMQSENSRGGSSGMEILIFYVLQTVFGLLGSLAVAYYSRRREFRADKGGAQLAGREKMVSALQALQKQSSLNLPVMDPDDGAFANFKISSSKGGNLVQLFSSHPPLELRISRLQHNLSR